VAQPGVSLEAKSAPTTSSARAATGADGGDAGAAARGVALARAALEDATVVAEATAQTWGLVVGPVTLGRVTSRARVSRGGGGEPAREQTLEVGGLTIAGQGVGIGPGGLLVGGTAIPLPDMHPARAALAQAGIGIRYLEAKETPDGVVAPGLLITQTLPASLTGSPSSVTYTIGRAGVAVQAAAGTETVSDPLLGVDPSAPDSAGGAVAIDAAPGPLPASAGTAPAIDGGGGSPAPASQALEPGGGAAAAGPSLSPTTGSRLPAAAARASHRPGAEAWSEGVYAALVVPGVLVLGAFFVIRVMGVKSIWAS
jgi:hypothetical protein